MASEDEIWLFLNGFHAKLGIWGLVTRDDRGKNSQALLDLEITPEYRKEVLKKLEVNDYSEGPLLENLYKGSDMWVFGKIVKQREIYIKITLGVCGAQVICISFHPAEFPMEFPLRSRI